MFPLSVNTLSHKLFLSPTPNPPLLHTHIQPHRLHSLAPKPISYIPAKSPGLNRNLYQPFRPPPSPLPEKFRSLDTAGRINILANRLGLWFEYAPLIPALVQEGFTPPTIEEATGISSVEQNRLVVAARVRDTLIEADTDPDVLSSFDTGGAELLYEIRLLSTEQRAAAARFIVENRHDAKMAQDLARSMKDYPRRRGEKDWESFDYNLPGDCLAYLYYRQALEHKNEQRTASLELALEAAQSESGKSVITEELEGKRGPKEGEKKEVEEAVKVPVVRLKIGEVSQARTVVVLPVCRSEALDREVLEAPMETKRVGEFSVVVSDKGWSRWVALPGWEQAVAVGDFGVAVSFPDARALPWKVNRWYKEEPILVVVDRARKEVEFDDGFYLVAIKGGAGDGKGDGLKVETGTALTEMGINKSLGTVVLVVRPPRDETGTEQEVAEKDWE